MAILDKQGLQHYANKMCNADNRKVGSKSLPTALNDIDTAIDGFKTLFESEYGTPVNMELENNENVFSIGTGTDIDKKDDVENSFTDLKIGGNTLVNLMPKIDSGNYVQLNASANWVTSSYRTTGKRLKPNTKYTVILDIYNNSLSSTNNFHVNVEHNNLMAFTEGWTVNKIGRHVKLFTTKSELSENMLAPRTQIETAEEGKYVRYSIILLEGDWTNKPLPQYFNGMLSVGDIVNNNIKLISQPNKPNLLRTGSTIPSSNTWWRSAGAQCEYTLIQDNSVPNGKYIKYKMTAEGQGGIYTSPISILEVGKTYTWSAYVKCSSNKSITMGCEQGGLITKDITTSWTKFNCTFIAISKANWALVFYLKNATIGDEVCIHSLKIEEGDLSDWCPNNEEILNNIATDNLKYDNKIIELSEPLRGLPNGIKDTIEKVNGEWKIIRRCGQDTLNGNSLTGFTVGAAGTSSYIGENVNRINFFLKKAQWSVNRSKTVIVCNNFSYIDFHVTSNGSVERNSEAICFHPNDSKYINLHILKSRLTEQTMAAARTWLNANPVTVVYELENYIIEDIDPITLQCWKNGIISLADEVIPAETTHTVALNKSAQIQKNIEELTVLRNRVKALEEQYDKTALNQAYEVELLRLDMQLDNII